jgi:ATP-dependent DNA helicase DinG
MLYCAAHLPDRRDPASEAAIHDELAALIEAAGGRTLALFTSRRAMDLAVAALRPRLSHPLLVQNEASKARLIEEFTQSPATCLFATMGFWQGIDVPGSTLSLVVIDRIPFGRPDDPLLVARREHAGPDAFRVVDLPRAASLLAQGAGRLIRTSADRGVVAVLDPRLANASYRWALIRALPPMRRSKERSEAEAFLREIAAAS